VQFKGKNILLTGATGFIGSHVTHLLVEHGYHVTALTSGITPPHRLSNIRHKLAWLSLADYPSLPAALSKAGSIEGIISTAVSYGRTGESQTDLLRANVIQPLELIEHFADHGLEVFINADTFYPPTRDSYSLSKRQLSDWLPTIACTKRIAIVNLALQHAYGINDGVKKFIPSIIRACLRNDEGIDLTRGEQTRDFVFASDVAEAFLAALQSPRLEKGKCIQTEIGSGNAISLRQAVELIKTRTNSSTKLRFGALEYAPHEIMHACANLQSARALGWAPRTSLDEGMVRTIAWHREQKEQQ
jgi:nucleoside-diphosphate-sugar epimerase